MRARIHSLPCRYSSVREDWGTWLPQAKAEAFDSCVRQLEVFYGIFSVSLNEALELQRTGNAGQSCRAVFVIPGLCTRLASPLQGLLHTLGAHARHFGIVPNAAPLDAANFRGPREQRTARRNDLLSQVLLTQRSQFLYKIETLGEMVFSLHKGFCEVAADLSSGESLEPSSDWRALDDAHFDLNTCLREAIVVLKSFIVALPDEQLGAFQKSVDSHMRIPDQQTVPDRRRRLALIERE